MNSLKGSTKVNLFDKVKKIPQHMESYSKFRFLVLVLVQQLDKFENLLHCSA